MFAYMALFVPIINGFHSIIGTYNLNIETLPGNLYSLGIGLATIIAKHGISYIISKIKGKYKFNKKILSEIETPIIHKIGNYPDDKEKNELIKEQ